MRTKAKISHVTRILKLQERARRSYEKADKLFTQLACSVPVGEIIEAGDRGAFQIVDNFANTNAAFRVARVSRLELKAISRKPQPKPAKTANQRIATGEHPLLTERPAITGHLPIAPQPHFAQQPEFAQQSQIAEEVLS